MKNIVSDTMAPNPWRDIPGVVADALHDAEGEIGHRDEEVMVGVPDREGG